MTSNEAVQILDAFVEADAPLANADDLIRALVREVDRD